MAYIDPRELSYTSKERTAGTQTLGTYGSAPVVKTISRPQQVVVESGDDFGSIANKLGIDEKALALENPEDNRAKPGTVLNVPAPTQDPYGGNNPYATVDMNKESIDPRVAAGWTPEEIWEDDRNPYGLQNDRISYQEELGVTGIDKFATRKQYEIGGQTYQGYDPNSQPYETEAGTLVFPEGWNTERFRHWANNMGTGTKGDIWYDTPFMEYFNGMDTKKTSTSVGGSWGNAEIPDYYPDEIRGPSGIPSSYKWQQNANGQWEAQPAENVFDELYIANGIDVNNKADIEWFWSLADDNLMFMGEFYDIFKAPTGAGGGGYGGGGYSYPSYRQSSQRPQDYSSRAAYLSLTSWSI